MRRVTHAPKEREPVFSEMWEPAVCCHLLAIAIRYIGPGDDLICPFAAACYALSMASLRHIDGTRSPPPIVEVVDGVPCFHSTAPPPKPAAKLR